MLKFSLLIIALILLVAIYIEWQCYRKGMSGYRLFYTSMYALLFTVRSEQELMDWARELWIKSFVPFSSRAKELFDLVYLYPKWWGGTMVAMFIHLMLFW